MWGEGDATEGMVPDIGDLCDIAPPDAEVATPGPVGITECHQCVPTVREPGLRT